MEEMPQEGMPPEAPKAPAEGGGPDLMGLVEKIGTGLDELAQVINSSDAASDEDRQDIGIIMDKFMGMVQRQMGGATTEPMGADMVPADGGMTGVPMGPQGRV
jgi:hypothetical protein